MTTWTDRQTQPEAASRNGQLGPGFAWACIMCGAWAQGLLQLEVRSSSLVLRRTGSADPDQVLSRLMGSLHGSAAKSLINQTG